ncbi:MULTISPECIES: uracil-DNA glycosylase [unclassified Bacillus (in: firmicutes)]|uniref:uracil-DNA glycosylase n=1 Tax=unclassified Bacillus (in: firmicutes) TaxID=185979 RepID=UPI000B85DE60|nr:MULTISPECIES: uracil-DNA glycosylase [unclassified Bacillus (in: firmicutes)]
MDQLKNTWYSLLKEEAEKDYFKKLETFLEEEYKTKTIFPAKEDIFHALNLTDYEKVKAVIIGQDPYHGEGQAHGLSFSVKRDIKIPPSLRNIYKELHTDTGIEIPKHGNLEKWAEEGVLLLNTVLTVREGQANSHKGMGWEKFTDRVISLLNERETPVVFILWGRPAQKKLEIIDQSRHRIILGVHPSPLSASRGFFGSRPFSQTNQYLREMGRDEIDWNFPKV